MVVPDVRAWGLSSLAENESISNSENNKWAIQKRFQNGTYIISSPPYGYENVNGEMVIVPEEAEIVRQIFADVLAGKSTHAIARELNERGITSKKGGKWTAGTINSIIRNEKFTGDTIFQKSYTDSNFNRHINYGEYDQYFCEEHHEAIVSHETFDRANEALSQYGKEKGNGENTERYNNRYEFSGKIKCGECGSVWKRRKHSKPREDYIAWCCTKHIKDKNACSMKFITDDSIKTAFLTMMNKLIFSRQIILKPLLHSLQGLEDKERLTQIQEYEIKIEKNKDQRKVLTSLRINGLLEPELFNKETNRLISEEKCWEKEKKQLMYSVNGEKEKVEFLNKLIKAVSGRKMLLEYDEALFCEHVEGITIISRDEILFELKCGLRLKERLVR